jgi:hypothetical protein
MQFLIAGIVGYIVSGILLLKSVKQHRLGVPQWEMDGHVDFDKSFCYSQYAPGAIIGYTVGGCCFLIGTALTIVGLVVL